MKHIFQSLLKKQHSHSPDIIILWEWEYDDDFVFYLSTAAREKKLVVENYNPNNLQIFINKCCQTDFTPSLIIDRISDIHANLQSPLTSLKHRGSFLINDPHQMLWCKDKATMHLELVSEGVTVPYGIIISHQDQPEQSFIIAAEKLGLPFVIKPSEGGGGEGVILDADHSQDIQKALQSSRTGKIVLQQKITPKIIINRPAWFRVFYLLGHVIPCWWDNETHLYHQIQTSELEEPLITRIETIMYLIAGTCQLTFFTSEFALNQENNLLVIDFVNEMCDLRLRSRHADGVPDALIFQLVNYITNFCQNLPKS